MKVNRRFFRVTTWITWIGLLFYGAGGTPMILLAGSGLFQSTSEQEVRGFAIYAPYWSTASGFVSTIQMKNYRVDTSLTVTPVLYPLNGHPLVLDSLTLNPSETRLLNINDALAAQGEASTEGAAELRYQHITEAVFGANLSVLNETKSLIFSIPFRAPLDTDRLEGVWWFLDQKTDGFVAVENAGAQAVTVTPTLYLQQRPYPLDPFELGAHEMKIIPLRRALRRWDREDAQEGGLQLQCSTPGALVAAGGLVNPDIGFSSQIQFGDPNLEAARSKKLERTLHALNVPIGSPSPEMGLPSSALLRPIVVLHNTAAEETRVEAVFKYQGGDSLKSFQLPAVQLSPRQTVRMELLSYWLSGQIPREVSWGSLEIHYGERSGALVAAVSSVDESGTYVFDARLENRLGAGFQGEYWSIEGDNNTFVTVKNITPKAATCGIALHYNQGGSTYEMPPLTLQPGEARVINLKRLQKEKIADAKGAVLPATATFGGLKLTEEAGGRHFLMEATVFNPRTATCGVCGFGCLYPLSLVTVPGGFDLLIAQQSGDITVNANMCDGTVQTGWGCQCDFSSNDTTVATVEALCIQHATGVGVGSTSLLGTATGIPGPRCGEQTLLTSCSVRVNPTVSISGPTNIPMLKQGTQGSDSITLTATGNPAGGTYSWTATAGQSNINIFNASSQSSILQSVAVGTYTVKVTYTYNGRQGTAVSSGQVQQPGSLGVVSNATSALNCRPKGLPYTTQQRQILYQVLDTSGAALPAQGITVAESLSVSSNSCNIAGPNATNGLTQSNGYFPQPDTLSMCSPQCLPAGSNDAPLGSCTMVVSQTWTANGFTVKNGTITYNCPGPPTGVP